MQLEAKRLNAAGLAEAERTESAARLCPVYLKRRAQTLGRGMDARQRSRGLRAVLVGYSCGGPEFVNAPSVAMGS